MKANGSIILPTYNKADYLDLTLTAFSLQTFKNFEIILINNGSTDHTADVIDFHRNNLNLTVHEIDNNVHLSKARNIALRLAQSDIIINVDDDRIPTQKFVEEHVDFLSHNRNKVSIGYKGVILSFLIDSLRFKTSEFLKVYRKKSFDLYQPNLQLFSSMDLYNNFDETINHFFVKDSSENKKDVLETFGEGLAGFHLGWVLATGGNSAFNRADALDIKFDENYSGWGLEDTDFAYQLALRGYEFRYNRQAKNYHQEHPRGNNEFSELASNIRYFVSKYNTEDVRLFARTWMERFFSLENANTLLLEHRAQSTMTS